MTSPAYSYEPGGPKHLRKADVAVVVKVVEGITKRRGRIAPTECAQAFLDVSRPKTSPTHHLFEWDDGAAAEAYRLGQARSIIASVWIRFEERPDDPVRAIPIVTYDGKRSYETMPKVLSKGEATAQLVAQAKAEALAWHKRWEHLASVATLAPAFAAIGKMKK